MSLANWGILASLADLLWIMLQCQASQAPHLGDGTERRRFLNLRTLAIRAILKD